MGFRANETGKCPHCGVTVRFERVQVNTFSAEVYMIQTPSQFRAILHIAGCPHCGKPVLSISKLVTPQGTEEVLDSLVWPDTVVRPVPPEVEAEDPVVAADFREAVAVLPKSKKAAAALARRCLQHILREKAGTKAKDLSKQIEEVLGQLPSQLAANLDAIRQVGNFAAHPTKSTSTGEIVEVEAEEAEWLLDVLEELFQYYYVQPARAKARREALNKKLRDLGKPPLKTPES
ncbi:DUF4145 domain-containing protein [Rhodothermus marinus]|uniref:DUF4145 domain-containing protein n=1 Tax=Rhodothermus marinus TaxID=29549 RepID=UPI0037C6060D